MARPPNPDRHPLHREHPWERVRRATFAQWEGELRRVPYGHSLPDVVGFASSIEPPADWGAEATGRRLFALSALPSGSGPTYLTTLPDRTRSPVDGSFVRVVRPVKRVLPVPGSTSGELLLEARAGIHPAAWEETLSGISPDSVQRVVSTLASLWRLAPSTVEMLLLPVVGSTPWHGRPAGIDLHVEVEGWSLARQRAFLAGVIDLAPGWVGNARGRARFTGPVELVSGARIQRSAASSTRPFSICLRSISSPPIPSPSEGLPPRSTFTYGPALASEFASFFSAGQNTLLVSSDEASRVPRGPVEIPDSVRATVWGLHWWSPEPPDTPVWHRWLREQEPKLRDVLDTLPGRPPEAPEGRWNQLADHREFRERLVQTTIGRARLRGAKEVESTDLEWAVNAWIGTIQRVGTWARIGRGPLSRTLDRTEGGRTTRLRRTIEALVQQNPEGLSLEEAVAVLGAGATKLSVENQLERLRIRGVLFQDRTGRYRVA